MNATAPALPMHVADPRRFVEMQAALSSAEMFRKKADEWDEAHGLGYHLKTAALLSVLTFLFWPLALYIAPRRFNPYRGDARALFARYRMTHDEIAKAHGLPRLPTLWEMLDGRPSARAQRRPKAAPTRPAQARRPSAARATLAA